MDEMTVTAAANGFIVTSVVPHHDVKSSGDVYVFITYEALMVHIKKVFGPMVIYGEKKDD